MLETLYRARWGRLDGLGALVLTPTRELAMQVRTHPVSGSHDFMSHQLRVCRARPLSHCSVAHRYDFGVYERHRIAEPWQD